LGRTFTGWIAPACGWRTFSINSSARTSKVGGISRPRALGSLEVDHQIELRRLLDWDIGRFLVGTDCRMTTMEPALVFAEVTGVIRIWNSGAEALFGHRAEDEVGRTLDLIVPPEYRERHWAGFRAAMAGGDGKVDRAAANVPAMHRDGTVIRVAVRLLVIHDARDRATGALAVFAQDDEAAPPLPRL
jgi:PAS domain S-box-containing protein